MSRPAFLAIGDLHLDAVIWRRYRQITGDAFYGFKNCMTLAVDRQLPIVLVGDIFDVVNPDPQLVKFFRQQMDRLAAEGVPVYVMQGNHDKRTTPWTGAIHDHPQYIGDGRPVQIGGLTCVAFDYDTRDVIQQKLVTLTDPPQVLFLHQAVRQALNFDGKWNCDLEWVPEGIPLTVMGDIHTPWQQQFRPGQRAYYTGATHARDRDQLAPKSCLQVSDDLSVERLPIDSRTIGVQMVTTDEQVEQLGQWLAQACARPCPLWPVLFVKHTRNVTSGVARIGAIYMGRAIVVADAVAEDAAEAEENHRLDDMGALSPQQLIQLLVDPAREPQAYKLACDLAWGTDSVLEVIRSASEHFTCPRSDV